MKAIDTKGMLNEYMLDPARLITQSHLQTVCKIHQGKDTCRYIARDLDGEGFVCMKNSKMQAVLDNQVAENKMLAQGDNCEGMVSA
jgi:hypothetical protein